MKVRELMSKLSTFNQDLEVLCYSEDPNILPKKHGFILLEINDVDLKEAEKTRCEDGIPSFRFDKMEDSKPHVLIGVTTDF